MAMKFGLDYAKRVAKCKKCHHQLLKGDLRMWRMVPNPFTAESANPTEMKNYFHCDCLFETLTRCRATTKVIESSDDIDGWEKANDNDKEAIMEKIKELQELRVKKFGDKVKTSQSYSTKETLKPKSKKVSNEKSKSVDSAPKRTKSKNSKKGAEKDTCSEVTDPILNSSNDGLVSDGADLTASGQEKKHLQSQKGSKFDVFKLFCKLCDVISSVSKFSEKTEAVRIFISKEGYDGDLCLLIKMLIPEVSNRIYNLKAKQMIKIFSTLLSRSIEEMTESYNQTGDVSQTICHFWSQSAENKKKSKLTNHMIDDWLEQLSGLTQEEDQQSHFSKICELASTLELKYIIRLVMKDLRINAGAKHILEGVRKGAYQMFQVSRNLEFVIAKSQNIASDESLTLESGILLNTPVKPMLAAPCRSIKQAMEKCNKEMYAEIKYDGERLQLHKDGDNFMFFSRSLKPVLNQKVTDLNKVVLHAFPTTKNLIVDAEMLLLNTKSGKPLPFGTLGVHKRKELEDAVVCLFVFDCIYYDNESLIEKTLRERRKYLEDNIKEVPNRVLLSNCHLLKKNESEKLEMLISKTIDEGLEGLVLKDLDGIYEPGKRHWLKVKKDYLEEGTMADAADLIVLGAYYGTGKKGGMMSVFLMGVYDKEKQKFCTVTKCGNGYDDATLDRINKELSPKMIKISQAYVNLPEWIECPRSLVPDFIVTDPKDSPVWEIIGAEFSRSDTHTASGISIRFPRVTRIRDDKNWETATDLQELKELYEKSLIKTGISVECNDEHLSVKQKLSDQNSAEKASVLSRKRQKVYEGKREEESVSENVQTNDLNHDEEIEAKKAKLPCKYGEQCYRKNPKHLKKFTHPKSNF
ncbi:unnamed protein product [Thelazia callipaeda]|uniref:DNA ligase 3 n=1 Tax=Thelazia callipaeda TaxID=103827 RepID=A0A0N5D6E1_THECL|nr:unnamed protein product [Thelazia callipaeda]